MPHFTLGHLLHRSAKYRGHGEVSWNINAFYLFPEKWCNVKDYAWTTGQIGEQETFSFWIFEVVNVCGIARIVNLVNQGGAGKRIVHWHNKGDTKANLTRMYRCKRSMQALSDGKAFQLSLAFVENFVLIILASSLPDLLMILWVRIKVKVVVTYCHYLAHIKPGIRHEEDWKSRLHQEKDFFTNFQSGILLRCQKIPMEA